MFLFDINLKSPRDCLLKLRKNKRNFNPFYWKIISNGCKLPNAIPHVGVCVLADICDNALATCLNFISISQKKNMEIYAF